MQPLQYGLRCPAAKKTKYYMRAQPRHQATLAQQCNLQGLACKTQKNQTQQPQKLQLQNRISAPKLKVEKAEDHICENEAFVQDFHRNLKVENVETKLLCNSSLQNWKRKMWKRSFRAIPSKKWKWKIWKRSFHAIPSKSAGGRCENEAFVRFLPQKVKVEDVKTKLSCDSSLKK